MFLCTEKMVFCKIVTKSRFVTIYGVTKSRLHCNQFFRLPHNLLIFFGNYLNILGFGSHQENCFLSFLQDNFLPIPYPMQSENQVTLTSNQRSWKRRVNVNTGYYFGIIICFSIMNFVLKMDGPFNLFGENPYELRWHHWNGTLLANLRLT